MEIKHITFTIRQFYDKELTGDMA